MNKKTKIHAIVCLFISSIAFSQSFPPPAGQAGSTAIHKDSSIIVGWATSCEVVRGYQNIENPSLGYASFGDDAIATGPASGTMTSVVSLGDGGTATLTFESTIINGPGPDFAVFENGVTDSFLELGFVEVSSDGVHFVRFPAVSEIPTNTQAGSFAVVNCRYIHNFAGKYRIGYGTPFDLEDIIDSTGIDIDAITHVRIVDVIGSIDPQYATYDSQGNIVNNLHPTPFESSGFDLDGIGVINVGELSLASNQLQISVYPNPTSSILNVHTNTNSSFTITNLLGTIILNGKINNGQNKIDVEGLISGIYFLTTENGNKIRFVKH
jgi:hypothetical protein